MAEPTSEVSKPATPEPTPPQVATPETVPAPRPFGMATPPESQAPVAAPSGITGILARIPILGRLFR